MQKKLFIDFYCLSMQINKITYHSAPINFGAGKTKLYTDFDGTYFPSKQYLVPLKMPHYNLRLKQMYDSFKNFFDVAQEQFKTIITTGRDTLDIQKALNILRKANIIIPKINGFVLENGIREIEIGDDCEISDNNFIIPDKLNHPKSQIRQIIEDNSNDLVIVAGNEWNDVNMLNPLNYIDLLGVKYDSRLTIDELLEKEDVLDAVKKLPLVSIVCGNSRKLNQILKMKTILDSKGIYKIFQAKTPNTELLQKIKQGMYLYSLENSEYKNNLNPKLMSEITNTCK